MRIVELGTGVHPRQALGVEDSIRTAVRSGEQEGTAIVYGPASAVTAGADVTWEDLASTLEVTTPVARAGGLERLGPGSVVVSCVTRMPDGLTLRGWRQMLLRTVAATVERFGATVVSAQRSAVRIDVDGRPRTVGIVGADVVDGVTTQGVAINVTRIDVTAGSRRSGRTEVALAQVLSSAPTVHEVGATFVRQLESALAEHTLALAS